MASNLSGEVPVTNLGFKLRGWGPISFVFYLHSFPVAYSSKVGTPYCWLHGGNLLEQHHSFPEVKLNESRAMAALASSEKTPLEGEIFPFIYYTSCYVLYCRSKSAYSGQYMTVTPWKTKTNFGESVPLTKKVIQIEKGEDTIQNPLKLPEPSSSNSLQGNTSTSILGNYLKLSDSEPSKASSLQPPQHTC